MLNVHLDTRVHLGAYPCPQNLDGIYIDVCLSVSVRVVQSRMQPAVLQAITLGSCRCQMGDPVSYLLLCY